MTENLISNGRKRYFFDTYALIEILNDNPRYFDYKDLSILTGLLNYGELLYHIMKEGKEKQSARFMFAIRKSVLQVGIFDMVEAMKFRYSNIKLKFSFVDSVGYAMAKRRGLVFLTGDKQFEHMPNVEFVKKD